MSVAEMTDTEVSRLRWQCRRGMLEVDLLLNRFLDRAYASLSDGEKTHFSALLEYPDQVLVEWLMGRARPGDPDLDHVVERIRDTFEP